MVYGFARQSCKRLQGVVLDAIQTILGARPDETLLIFQQGIDAGLTGRGQVDETVTRQQIAGDAGRDASADGHHGGDCGEQQRGECARKQAQVCQLRVQVNGTRPEYTHGGLPHVSLD